VTRAPDEPIRGDEVRGVTGMRTTHLLGVVGLALGLGGAFYLVHRGAERRSAEHRVRAKRALAPYRQLERADLDVGKQSPELARRTAYHPAAFVSRVLLRPVSAGTPIAESALGPWLPPGSLTHRFVSSVPLREASRADARVEPGRTLQLVLAWPGAADPIGGVLVLNVSADRSSMVVAVPAQRANDFARAQKDGYVLGTFLGSQ
jgi:hypothetical protein